MKKFTLSVAAVMAMSTFAIAGGDIEPVPVVAAAPIVEDYSSFYVGLGYAFISADVDGTEEGNAYSLIAGYNYNQYIAIEGRYTDTVGDMDVSDDLSSLNHPDGSYERQVTSAAIYLKPQYPVTSQMNAYALLGYANTTIDYTNGIQNSTTDENGFSYGAGFEYDFGVDESLGAYSRIFDGQGDQEKGWGLWVDVQHLLNDAGAVHTTSNILTAGITYDF